MSSEHGPPASATVVVSHHVIQGKEAEYVRWQQGINAATSRYPGYQGAEMLRPVAGVQDDWVVVFRFDSAANLQRWLDSDERATWLERAEPLVESFVLQKIGGGLGGWFEISAAGDQPRVAPAWKQGMAVLVALYPVVMILRLVLQPALGGLHSAPRVLLANLASVAVLTYALMPAVTRALRWWLDPRASAKTSAAGAALLVGLYAAMTAGFWLAL